MEPKKISFGFSKINKKLNLSANKECFKNESKVDLIKCLEGHEIKLIEEKPKEQLLIIPLKESQKTSAALASLIKRRAVLLGEDEHEPTNAKENNKKNEDNLSNSNNEPENIEKRAARELLAELQANVSADPTSNLVLPVVNPDELPLEGAKESSLDDYESIPIVDFGKAMLRGMGWSEPTKVVTKGGPPIDETPTVRPKGMGLGADKALKKQPLLIAPESNEVLEIKRNAYVRILGGKHKDLYGQIEGFDDHAGRVIVKMAIGGTKEAFNEFLCQPISRKEFAQFGKCINSSKYEEYKKKENEFGQIILKKEKVIEAADISTNIKKERPDYRDKNNWDERDRKIDYKIERKEFKTEKAREDERDRKQENNSDSTKEFKKEKNRDESDRRRENYRGGDNNRKVDRIRDDVHDRTRNKDRGEGFGRGRNLNRDDEKVLTRDKYRYNSRDRNTERDAHGSKYDERNQHTQSYNEHKERGRERESYKGHDKNSYREYSEKDFNKDRHSQNNSRDDERSRDNDIYAERSLKHSDKVIQILDSSDSENVSQITKHNKSSKKDKTIKRKSKKSRKSKSKNVTSDSETSSVSSSSEDKRRKKHKKKTKKSKKQRERSRSR